MTESKLHKIVKNGVAQASLQDSFNVETEYTNKVENERRIDFYASKPDGELVKVEVVNTHVLHWLLIKLDSNNQKRQSIYHSIAVSRENYDILCNMKIGLDSFDDVIGRLLKSTSVSKKKETTEK